MAYYLVMRSRNQGSLVAAISSRFAFFSSSASRSVGWMYESTKSSTALSACGREAHMFHKARGLCL